MKNEKLTDKSFWQIPHNAAKSTSDKGEQPDVKSDTVYSQSSPLSRGYASYILYDVECPKYFPEGELKVLEVGSSPGYELIAAHNKFGYIPFGVDYSETGVETNQKVFAEHDLPIENVIHADIFDDSFHDKYREKFDIVMSHGFIEHFTDIEDIIDRHTNLLKSDGLLLLTVPNFRWINYLFICLFARQNLGTHNLSIMKKANLLSFFTNDKYDVLTCKYFGTWNFGMYHWPYKNWFKAGLLKLMMFAQKYIDKILHLFFKNGFIDSPLFSPRLMIICRKKK